MTIDSTDVDPVTGLYVSAYDAGMVTLRPCHRDARASDLFLLVCRVYTLFTAHQWEFSVVTHVSAGVVELDASPLAQFLHNDVITRLRQLNGVDDILTRLVELIDDTHFRRGIAQLRAAGLVGLAQRAMCV